MTEKELRLEIEGMHCDHCAHFVGQVLDNLEGVVEQKVNHSEGKAFVKYQEEQIDAQKIVHTINETPYSAKMNT